MTLPNFQFTNHHATCLSINSIGIMIEGPSGSGKTCLALGLLEAALVRKIEHAFICDDQAMLTVTDKTLWAHTPPTIAGKVELFGQGIIDIDYKPSCKIDIVCHQTPQTQITRLPTPSHCTRLGIELPLIHTPRRHEAHGVRIILQALSLPLSIKN